MRDFNDEVYSAGVQIARDDKGRDSGDGVDERDLISENKGGEIGGR